VKVEPAAAAVKAELDAIAARGVKPWRTVVLAQASVAEAKELARAVPRIDLIVVRLLDDEEKPEPAAREGTADIVTTGRKGMYVGRYRFGLDGDLGEFAPEAVIDTLEKSQSIRDILSDYRELVRVDRLIDACYAREPDPNGAAYAGADEATCAQCHAKAWEIWKSSRHAHAWRTLEEQDLPETAADKKGRLKNAIWDPECVVCHTTGFGKKTGYRGLDHEKADAPLVNVSCEACHGPSGDHAERAMKGDSSWPGGSIARIAGGAASSLCMRCHDSDNSTGFDLKEFWVGRVRGEQREPVAHGKD
jgi:cytochrome c554/c'-like protein